MNIYLANNIVDNAQEKGFDARVINAIKNPATGKETAGLSIGNYKGFYEAVKNETLDLTDLGFEPVSLGETLPGLVQMRSASNEDILY